MISIYQLEANSRVTLSILSNQRTGNVFRKYLQILSKAERQKQKQLGYDRQSPSGAQIQRQHGLISKIERKSIQMGRGELFLTLIELSRRLGCGS